MTDERMTAEEIRVMYREAKDQDAQIGILADINLCKRMDIIRIINGETDELPPITEKYHHIRKGRGKNYVPPNALTDKEKQEIIRLHLEGLQGKDIADKLGRSPSAVSKTILSYKEGVMTFTEEQTPEQNEKLLQEITEKISPKSDTAPVVGVGVAEIAGALMDFITDNLHGCIVEVRAKDDGYIVHVTSDTDDIVLTRRTDRENA